MEKTNWSITSEYMGWTKEEFLFTYNESEKQEHEINKNNAELVLNPKFIPLYPKLLQNGYGLVESILFWFIEFFLSNNDKFYCTNEQMAQLLNCSEHTISDAIKSLEKRWDIVLYKKIKAWWWKIRFIKLWNYENAKIAFREMQKVHWIDNKIIENKSLSLEWEKILQTTQSSEREKDTHTPSSTKEWTPPTPPQLLEAYENEKSLVQMIWNSKAVLERAEYKQSKKSRAYKTVSWFIQQLYGKVDTVRFWEVRWDTWTRFEYAVNKTKENEWKDIYRTEKEEREYQFYKKSLYLKKQENE